MDTTIQVLLELLCDHGSWYDRREIEWELASDPSLNTPAFSEAINKGWADTAWWDGGKIQVFRITPSGRVALSAERARQRDDALQEAERNMPISDPWNVFRLRLAVG